MARVLIADRSIPAQVLAKKQAVATQARFELAQAQKRAFSQVLGRGQWSVPKAPASP